MLTLLPLTPIHAKVLYALIDESRDGLKNLLWSEHATLESTRSFLNEKQASRDRVFGIYAEHTLVGVLELRNKGAEYELGYWLGTEHRHHGYMKTAVKMLVDEAVKDKAIIAHIRETNLASLHTLEYAGLTRHHSEEWNGEQWLHLRREELLCAYASGPSSV